MVAVVIADPAVLARSSRCDASLADRSDRRHRATGKRDLRSVFPSSRASCGVSSNASVGAPLSVRCPASRAHPARAALSHEPTRSIESIPSPPARWLIGPAESAGSPFVEVRDARPWDWRVGESDRRGAAALDSNSQGGALPADEWPRRAALAGVDGALQLLAEADAAMTSDASSINPEPYAAVDSGLGTSKSLDGPAAPSGWRRSVSRIDEDEGDDIPEVDIADRLPELREMLQLLREKAQSEAEQRGAAEGERGAREEGPGNVFLVGTGPGDPDLLTLKAVRALQGADLVLYDRLVSPAILRLASPSARLLYVGKAAGYHTRTQAEILHLLLAFAQAGAAVVRLKGGDPLVFGRGGEEMDYLQANGIKVQIVPGITAASGIAAELGVPLTHRGVANSVRFLTGHKRKGGGDPLYGATTAVDPDATLVVYMGLATLPSLATRLLANGLPADTPAVAVERGTTAAQRTVFSTLEDLPRAVSEAQLVSPTLIVIGQVVALSPFWPFAPTTSAAVDHAPDLDDPRDRRLRGPDPLVPSQQIRLREGEMQA